MAVESSRTDCFGDYHPAVVLGFFAYALGMGVLLFHPAFAVVGLGGSAAYLTSVRGRRGVRFVLGLVPFAVVLAALNPLFSTTGETVLFAYAGDRPYTVEALAFGAVVAAMLVSVLVWCAAFNAVMSGDKLVYLLGPVAPAVSLVLLLVLRFVPSFRRKAGDIALARAGIGRGVGEADRLRVRVNAAGAVLSSLTTWALERGMVSADSLVARGWGSGRRTSYRRYRFARRDAFAAGVLGVLAVCSVAGALEGAASAEYLPHMAFAPVDSLFTVTLAAYAAALLAPTILNVRERLVWRFSLLNI